LEAPGGFPIWESRHAGRPSKLPVDEHRNTVFVNLRENSATEVQGWCRDCRKIRTAKVAALLAASSGTRRSIVLA
jgi:hypothetical protein